MNDICGFHTAPSYVPINGIPHIAYLAQMLEKGGGFAIRIFSEGLALSKDCPNPLKWHTQSSFVVLNAFGKFFVTSTIPMSSCHTPCMTGRYGVFVKGM